MKTLFGSDFASTSSTMLFVTINSWKITGNEYIEVHLIHNVPLSHFNEPLKLWVSFRFYNWCNMQIHTLLVLKGPHSVSLSEACKFQTFIISHGEELSYTNIAKFNIYRILFQLWHWILYLVMSIDFSYNNKYTCVTKSSLKFELLFE